MKKKDTQFILKYLGKLVFVAIFIATLFNVQNSDAQEIIASQYFNENLGVISESLDGEIVISKSLGAISTTDNWGFIGVAEDGVIETSDDKFATDPYSLKIQNFGNNNTDNHYVHFETIDISDYDNVTFSVGFASDGEQGNKDDLEVSYEYYWDDPTDGLGNPEWFAFTTRLVIGQGSSEIIDFGETIPSVTEPNPFISAIGSIPNDATQFKVDITAYNKSSSGGNNKHKAYYIDDVVLYGSVSEIKISGNDVLIENGQTETSITNNTDFGDGIINESLKNNQFIIENLGNLDLELTGDPLVLLSGDRDDFIILAEPNTPVEFENPTSFSIVFQPKTVGNKSVTVSIENSDLTENPYTFVITGNGIEGDFSYCDPTNPSIPNNSTSFYISNLDVEEIDNTSTYVDPTRYSYFTEATTNFDTENSSFVRLTTVVLENSVSGIGAWIDFNNDGDFEDENEEIHTSSYTANTGETSVERSFNFLVPATAKLGVTRMRIAVQEGEIPTPCGPFTSPGEVEDYDITIIDLATAVPEIVVIGNGTQIINDDANPNPENNTDFGARKLISDPKSEIFSIVNIGGIDLTLTGPTPYIEIIGDTGDFTLTQLPTSPIGSIESTPFEITFNPQSEGVKSAIISIANSDDTKDPFAFAIQGEGFIPKPEIDVLGLGILINNGDVTPQKADNTDYGNIEVNGSTLEHTFSITNVGNLDLLLYDNPIIEISGSIDNFVLITPPTPSISPTDGTTFTIAFDPIEQGQHTITVALLNNDEDENPFEFDITGYGILDDYCGVLEPIDMTSSLSYYISNVTTENIDNTSVFDPLRYSYYPSITPDYTIEQTYDMSVTCEVEANQRFGLTVWIDYNLDGDFDDVGEEIYTTLEEGTNLTSVQKYFQFTIPPDATPEITRMRVAMQKGAFPEPCGPYSDTGEIEDYLVNLIEEGIIAPKMNVVGNGISITSGDSTPSVNDGTYFGSAEIGALTTNVYTIENNGTLDLSLTGNPTVLLTGDVAHFSLVQSPTTPIFPSSTTSFSIQFNPSEVGEKSVIVEILNNDPIRSPYTFRVQGSGKLLNDNDGDLVLDENDADDDNDGVLDVEENSDCNSSIPYITALFGEDFGTQSLDLGTPSVTSPYVDINYFSYGPLETGTIPDTDNSLTAGKYSVFNNIQEASSWASNTWQTIGDHTRGGTTATSGRMAMFNTGTALNSIYYKNTITANIEKDIPLDVSLWVLNLDTDTPDNNGRVLPNIEVVVEQGGNNYSVLTTGGILRTAPGVTTAWKNFKGSFIPTTNEPITIIIIDRAGQGNGNELAIDDISISQTQVICDVDSDGIPNKFDLDSDNDGLYDVVEVGGLDANNNGWADDNNDNTDNTDTNGIPSSAGSGLTPTITEGEHPDYVDFDSDNDGCSDANEAYANINADGGDGGYYGEGTPSVLDNGTVSGALYISPADGDGNNIPDFIQTSQTIVDILRNPFDAVVLEGDNVILSVEMNLQGEGTAISYQWQEDSNEGFVDLVNDGKYEGVTTALIRILNVDYSMSGNKYRVLIDSKSFVCDEDLISAEAELIIQVADLVTTKTVGNLNPSEGDEVNYVIDVVNNGPNEATSVSVIDLLPVEVTYISDNTDGDYNPVDGVWLIGNLSVGSTEALIITASVNAGLNGALVSNQITVVNLDQLDFTTAGDILVAEFITNDFPTAGNDAITVDEDSGITNINVLVNDNFGADGPSTEAIKVVSGSTGGGTVTVDDNGSPTIPTDDTINYTPNEDFNGVDTFSYEIMDSDGDIESATVTVTVNSIDDAPTAVNDVFELQEDSDEKFIPVTSNDDFGGDGPSVGTITLDLSSIANGATVSVDDNGTSSDPTDDRVSYKPFPNFNGEDKFDYVITDLDGDTSIATVTVTVNSVDDMPAAVLDSATTDEDVSTNIDVLANDDFGGDGPSEGPIEVTSSSTTQGGIVVVNNNETPEDPTDDTIDYTPAEDFNGTDTFDYNILDFDDDISSARVSVTVRPVNDTPTAEDDAKTVQEDSSENIVLVLGNDDFGGDGPSTGTITLETATIINGATITVGDSGTPDNPIDDIINYTPAANYNGTDTFSYTLADSDGDLSTATVTVRVILEDDLPVAEDDTASTEEDTSINIDVLVNDDFGGDNPSVGPIEVTSASTAKDGIVVVNDNGTPNNPTDDTIDYTPKSDFNGVDTFDYDIKDLDGDISVATVTVTVSSVNDVPVAVDDARDILEDADATIFYVLSNDDFGGDGPSDETITISTGTTSNGGTVVVDDGTTPNGPTDDTIIYTPAANYNGTDSFTYTIKDSDVDTSTATVIITIDSVNDTPTAVDDTATTDEDILINIDVLTNDDFGGDGPVVGDLTVIGGTSTEGGIVTININGTPDIPTDDTIDYTPNVDFNGVDTFEYELIDSDGDKDIGLVTITVNSINDTPTAFDDTATMIEDGGSIVINTANNDDFGGDGPSTGTILLETTTIINGATITVGDGGTSDDPSDDIINYTPAANYNGTDSFDYTIADSDGDLSTATVTVTVTSVDDAPVAQDDTASTSEDTPINIDVLVNDNFGGDNPSVGPIEVTSASTAKDGIVIVNDNGTPNNPTDDTIDYTPKSDFNGVDTFDYDIKDLDGDISVATVTVTVSSVNDVPVAVDDPLVSIPEDSTNSVLVVLPNDDFGGDGPGTFVLENLPANGTAIIDNRGNSNVLDDVILYTPTPDFNGVDPFTYFITDADGDKSSATVIVTVTPVNDLPNAQNDVATTNEDTPKNIDVLTNDSFGGDGPNNGTIQVISNSTEKGGAVAVNIGTDLNDPTDDTIDYTPAQDFYGTDTFSYAILDSNEDISVAIVTITINSINDVPVAVNDNAETSQGSEGTSITVLANDDFGGDGESTKTIIISGSGPSDGTATVNDGGTPSNPLDDTIFYAPNEFFTGSDSFDYTIEDSNGDTSSATVTISVEVVIDNPVASDDSERVNEDSTTNNIDVLANDSFGANGPSLTAIILATTPSNGTAVINNGGTPTNPTDDTIDYIPAANFNGEDSFTYTISDKSNPADNSTATVTITVLPVNDTPQAEDDAISVLEDSSANVIPVVVGNGSGVVADDFGGDGPNLGTIILGSGGTQVNASSPTGYNATIVVDDNNTPTDPTDDFILYTPTEDFFGNDSFTYTISDSNRDTSTATVAVTVTSENDLPLAVLDFKLMLEDDPLTNIDVLVNDDFGGDGPGSGVITISSGTSLNGGTVVVNTGTDPDDPTDDSIDYTPAPNYNGDDSFEYTIKDSNDDPSTATVVIFLDAVNDLPTAVADAIEVDEDSEDIVIDVLDNDSFGGDGPNEGSITLPEGAVTGQDDTGIFNPSSNDGLITVDDNDTPNDPTDDRILYSPASNFHGPDYFVYAITDSNGDESRATVTITVNYINDLPTAVADAVTLVEDAPLTNILVLINDDFGGDGPGIIPITISVSPTVQGAAIVVNNGGTPDDPTDDSIDYTPLLDFYGEDIFTYTIEDSNGDSGTSEVTVTVLSVNDLPAAEDDSITVAEDSGAILIDVTLNDDFGGDGPSKGSIILTASSTPNGGRLTVDNSGTPENPSDDKVAYTPELDYNGPDSFTYTIKDSNDDESTATVSITVTPVNDLPIAEDDLSFMFEDGGTHNILVTSNDDFGGDGPSTGTIILPSLITGTGAGVAVNDGGTPNDPTDDSIDYTPVMDFNGPDSFEYRIADIDGEESTGAVYLEVFPTNDLPMAVDDALTVDEDSEDIIIDVLDNDSFGGDGPNMGSITLPEGAVTGQDDTGIFNPSSNDGLITVDDNHTPNDPTDDRILYSPAPNFNGTDYFVYAITDSNGDVSAATVTITMNPINDLPMAEEDEVVVNEDSGLTSIEVLENDTFGGDGPNEGTIIITSLITSNNATIAVNDNGTLNDPTDDTIDYTPADNFNGADSFDYTIIDFDGDESHATVNVIVNSVNDLPIAVADAITVDEDSKDIVVDVLLNDSFGGDGPSEGSITLPEGAVTGQDDSGLASPSSNDGLITVDDNGTPTDPTDDTILYSPAPDFHGIDYFVYAIADSNGDVSRAVVTINVIAINDLPMALDDRADVLEDSGLTNIDVLENDNFGGDGPSVKSITIVTSTTFNGATINVNDGGTPDDPTDDTVDYTPAPNYFGIDTFSYTIEDSDCDQVTADVVVDVLSVNDLPLAVDDIAYADEDSKENLISVLSNDNFGGDGPSIGTIVLVSSNTSVNIVDPSSFNGTVIVDDNGTPNDPTDDTILYTPAINFNGEDTFGYRIEDSNGDFSEAIVKIIVAPKPDVNDDWFLTNEDEPVILDILSNDNDIDPNSVLTFSSLNGGEINIDNNGANETILDDIITYIPFEDYNGIESFSYEICDSDGDCVKADVLISITPKLDVENNFYLVRNNRVEVLDIYANDNDLPDNGSVVAENPTNGILDVDDRGTPNNPSDDIFTYTPNKDFVGVDNFTYTICDAASPSYCETAEVLIYIVESGANDDFVVTNEDTAVEIQFLTNDLGVPNNGVITVESPVNGNVIIDTNDTPTNISDDVFIYTPNTDFNGVDSFMYTISDVNDYFTGAVVTVTVTPGVDLLDDIEVVDEDASVEIRMLNNDNDIPTSGSLSISNPTSGTAIIIDNETPSDISDDYIIYTPIQDFNGKDSFKYTICDIGDDSKCTSATIDITVNPIIDVEDDNVETLENVEVFIYVLENDNDIPATGTITVANPAHGIVALDNSTPVNSTSDRYLLYTPEKGYIGEDSFTYTICDDTNPNNCGTATVFVNVTDDITNNQFILPGEQGSNKKGFGFSPNGDGVNDLFKPHSYDGEVFAEELYPNFAIQIFNRWGDLLYEYIHDGQTDSEVPGWDGNAHGKRVQNNGGLLPVGTYFYTLHFNDNIRKPYSGWIYLSR